MKNRAASLRAQHGQHHAGLVAVLPDQPADSETSPVKSQKMRREVGNLLRTRLRSAAQRFFSTGPSISGASAERDHSYAASSHATAAQNSA